MMLAEGVILDGNYRLRQLLGRGGMGQVWEAEHTRLPKRFAVKLLLGLSHAEPELAMRFRREAEIASRLNHPSIVQVVDFNTLADGTAYIVMERLEGEDLRARLERGPIALADVREIVRQVASALELAHQKGIVHRDLKPENVFLCREPDGQLRAKVLDFGISKVRDAGTHATRDDRVLGTPGYMAPEQALGRNSSIDSRTDVFSLATIVYEMLTGQGVFVGETLAELCTKVLYHTPPPLEEVLPLVPRALSQAVSRALSKEPDARQSDVRAFAAAVAGVTEVADDAPLAATVAAPVTGSDHPRGRALDDLPRDAAPDGVPTRAGRSSPRPPRPPRPRGRARGIAAAGGAAAMLLVLGVSWRLVPSSSPAKPTPAPRVASAAPSPDAALLQAASPLAAVPSASETVDAGLPRALPESVREPSRRPAPRPRERLSESAESELAKAEAALGAGDFGTALRLARNTLRELPSERAYAAMARAYCGQRDIGMVQAMLRNLPAGSRQAVRKDCQARGVSLP